MDLLDELQSRVIPGDGAMGTTLIDSGYPLDASFEGACLSAPELVTASHERHVAAGARVIRTNSFSANAWKLEMHELADRVNEINWTASQLARAAARGKGVYVAGSVGPLGISAAQALERGIDRKAVFRDQIGALLDGGADFIFFESFDDEAELALALEVKQELHHCPAVCSLTLSSGLVLADAFATLLEAGADIVGVSGAVPEKMLRFLESVPAETPLAAYPHAGSRRFQNGEAVYEVSPAAFAGAARLLVAQGANLVGGGVGAGLEHIAALAEAVRDLKPVASKSPPSPLHERSSDETTVTPSPSERIL